MSIQEQPPNWMNGKLQAAIVAALAALVTYLTADKIARPDPPRDPPINIRECRCVPINPVGVPGPKDK